MGRLGRVMRWGVYMSAGAMPLLFVCSFFVNPTFSIDRYPTEAQPGKIKRDLAVSDGRLIVITESDPSAIYHHPAELKREVRYIADVYLSGLYFKLSFRQPAYPMTPAWWDLPRIQRAASGNAQYSEVFIPFTYPTILLLGVSIWVWAKSRKYSLIQNQCSCGYSLEGLPSPTCPECGVERG